jgi:hypothetical protein
MPTFTNQTGNFSTQAFLTGTDLSLAVLLPSDTSLDQLSIIAENYSTSLLTVFNDSNSSITISRAFRNSLVTASVALGVSSTTLVGSTSSIPSVNNMPTVSKKQGTVSLGVSVGVPVAVTVTVLVVVVVFVVVWKKRKNKDKKVISTVEASPPIIIHKESDSHLTLATFQSHNPLNDTRKLKYVIRE